MSIIKEIVNFILERFYSCLAEVLQAIEDVLEDVGADSDDERTV